MKNKLYFKEKSKQFEDTIRKSGSYDEYRSLLADLVNLDGVNACVEMKDKTAELARSTAKLFNKLFGTTDIEIIFTISNKEIIDAKIVTGPTKLPNLKPLPLDVRYFVADSYLKMFPSSATAKISIMKLENDVKQSNQEPYCKTNVRCWFVNGSTVTHIKTTWL